MKILISNDSPTAHMYVRLGWKNAFEHCGHEVYFWDLNSEAAFDVFNKFEPDIFISQTYNLNNDIIKCIKKRPNLKVCCKAPDFGETSNQIRSNYPILYVDQEELNKIRDLKEKTGKPDFLFVHYHPDYLEQTHGYWMREGFKVESLLNAADVKEFVNGQYDDRLACDLSFIGGSWGYKNLTLAPYIMSLCEDFSYNIKLFGNQPWSCPQYGGFLENHKVKDLFSSTKINLNCHEKHSQDFGWDIVERPFKILSNGGFLVSDYVEGLEKLLPEIPMGKTPEEYRSVIDFFLNRPEDRRNITIILQKKVIANHTYFNRAKQILNAFDLPSPNLDALIEKLGGKID